LKKLNLAGKTIVDLVGIAGLADHPDVDYKGVAW
jgi:hypothetical protein